MDEVSFGVDVFVVDGEIDRAINRFRVVSADVRFETMKRLRYGPKPSDKRRNKHWFRKDYLNPRTGRLARSHFVPALSKGDRCSGKGSKAPGRHWY